MGDGELPRPLRATDSVEFLPACCNFAGFSELLE
jgi:hypothetical protein